MESIVAYSVFPYLSKNSENNGINVSKRELRARECFYAFKNGRGTLPTDSLEFSFESMLEFLVDDAKRCPAFRHQASLLPVPRSGKSADSYEPDSSLYPCLDLSKELQAAGLGCSEDLLYRSQPRVPSSSGSGNRRPKFGEELASHQLFALPQYDRVVLIDDSITKGTTMAVAAEVLRRAGYLGEIIGFSVAQTVHPSGKPEHRKAYLEHEIRWNSATEYVKRTDGASWKIR